MSVVGSQRIEIGRAEGNDVFDPAARGQRLEHGAVVDAIACVLGRDDVSSSRHSEQNRTSNAESASVLDHVVKQFDLADCQMEKLSRPITHRFSTRQVGTTTIDDVPIIQDDRHQA